MRKQEILLPRVMEVKNKANIYNYYTENLFINREKQNYIPILYCQYINL